MLAVDFLLLGDRFYLFAGVGSYSITLCLLEINIVSALLLSVFDLIILMSSYSLSFEVSLSEFS